MVNCARLLHPGHALATTCATHGWAHVEPLLDLRPELELAGVVSEAAGGQRQAGCLHALRDPDEAMGGSSDSEAMGGLCQDGLLVWWLAVAALELGSGLGLGVGRRLWLRPRLRLSLRPLLRLRLGLWSLCWTLAATGGCCHDLRPGGQLHFSFCFFP